MHAIIILIKVLDFQQINNKVARHFPKHLTIRIIIILSLLGTVYEGTSNIQLTTIAKCMDDEG
jgi:hypothetical protein